MTLLVEPEQKLMTVDEFLAMPGSEDYELVDGVPTEKRTMGTLSSFVGGRFFYRLTSFCEQTGAGHTFPADTVYQCFGNPQTGRKPDASFIRKGRLPNEQIPEGVLAVPADVVIEVVSPNDLAYDVEAKADLYLRNGFGELWVAFPNTRTVHVRQPSEPALIIGPNEVLVGRGPLAGFTCAVRELFQAPA